MSILYLQHWDVIPGKFNDYSDFISLEYNPILDKLGIKLVGGYYVVVGQGPRIIAVGATENEECLHNVLGSREYRQLNMKLIQHVWKYSSKIYVPTGKIHESPYRIQTGVWKFNLYYNLLRGVEIEAHNFMKKEAIPGMKYLNVPITGNWRLVIGSGPRLMVECTAKNIVNIAKAIDTTDFKKIIRQFKNDYATDYSTQILAPTGRIEVPHLVQKMMENF